MSGRLTKKLMNVLAVAAILVLVYIAFNTDFSQIWGHVEQLPWGLLVTLILLQLVTQFSLNYQWFRLCHTLGLKATFGKLLLVNAYGVVVDASNPGEKVGGEIVRVLQLKNLLGFDTAQATSLVTIQKLLSLASLVILNAVAVLTLSADIPFKPAVRVVLLAILFLLAALLVYALFFTERLNTKVQALKSKGKLVSWLKRWIANLAKDTKAIAGSPREWVWQFLLSLFIWALFPGKLFLIVSRYADVHPFALCAITFVSYFAAMIPILPGGLGTFEATMSGMLAAYGLTLEEGIAISLIFRFITFWFVVLFSVLIILAAKIVDVMGKIR